MNSSHLIERFRKCRINDEPMVLVTVFDTLGSTYSKAGSRMLITAGGERQGLVSGGCLEGDLAERARRVLDTGQAETVTYDLRDESDELFGLGVGCNGLIRVLLQPLTPDNRFEPMATIARALLGDETGAIATLIDSDVEGMKCGDSFVLVGDESSVFGIDAEYLEGIAAACRDVIQTGAPRLIRAEDSFAFLCAPMFPVTRVLILGAGPDAVPLINVLAELGWRVWVGDHRSAYLARDGLERAEALREVNPGSVSDCLDLSSFDAIVVMSHHLATDREYLRELADSDARYLGLLGPPARKLRLLQELGSAGERLGNRLRGPVGIDIGADTAESIAVSIAAEMQQVLVRAVGSDSHRKA